MIHLQASNVRENRLAATQCADDKDAPEAPLLSGDVAELETDGQAVRRILDEVIADETYRHRGLSFSHEGELSTDEVFDFRMAVAHSSRRIGVVLVHLKQGWTAKITEHEGRALVYAGGQTAIPEGHLPGKVRSLVAQGIERMAR